jgi:hypothetical protein
MKDLSNRGFISSILLHHGDYFVGYSYNGVVILKKAKKKYLVQPLPINVGIFCMVKDRYQDVIWIGSDGQGVANRAVTIGMPEKAEKLIENDRRTRITDMGGSVNSWTTDIQRHHGRIHGSEDF